MDVSIIIINFNTKELTINCIDSIISQTVNITYEIIVCDNASIDGSQRAIQLKFPNIVLIESAENLGFGKANNLGAEVAQGRYLFFLNSDTVLLNNSIDALYSFNIANHERLNIGVSGGILLDKNGFETLSFGPLPSLFTTLISILGLVPRFTKMTKSELKDFISNGYLEVGYITGADLFISKSIFKAIGGFDPNIFMYYEESDLQLRLNHAKFHNYVIAATKIVHLEGASLNQLSTNNKKRLIITKSIFYYFRKHSKSLAFKLFKILFFSIRITTLLYFSYSWKEKWKYLLQILKA